ncbi:hypothetical protein CCP4SC76_5320004 [Gammaproteobacteria bacterium]
MTIQKNWLQELETRAAAGDQLAHRILGLFWAGLVRVETQNGVRWLIPASTTALFFWHQILRPWAVELSISDGELMRGHLQSTKESQWIKERMIQSIELITSCIHGYDDFRINSKYFIDWGARLVNKGLKILKWIPPVIQVAWDIDRAISHLQQGMEKTLFEGYALLAVLALDAHRHEVSREALKQILELPTVSRSCEGLDCWAELARQFIPRIAYVRNHSSKPFPDASSDELELAKKVLATSDIFLHGHEMTWKYGDLPIRLLNKSCEAGYAEGAFFLGKLLEDGMDSVERFLRISRSARKLFTSNIMKIDIFENELYDFDCLVHEIHHYYNDEEWVIEDFVMSEIYKTGMWLHQHADSSYLNIQSIIINIIKLAEENLDKLMKISPYFRDNDKNRLIHLLTGFVLYSFDSISNMLCLEKSKDLLQIIKVTDEILMPLKGVSEFRNDFNICARVTDEGWDKLLGTKNREKAIELYRKSAKLDGYGSVDANLGLIRLSDNELPKYWQDRICFFQQIKLEGHSDFSRNTLEMAINEFYESENGMSLEKMDSIVWLYNSIYSFSTHIFCQSKNSVFSTLYIIDQSIAREKITNKESIHVPAAIGLMYLFKGDISSSIEYFKIILLSEFESHIIYKNTIEIINEISNLYSYYSQYKSYPDKGYNKISDSFKFSRIFFMRYLADKTKFEDWMVSLFNLSSKLLNFIENNTDKFIQDMDLELAHLYYEIGKLYLMHPNDDTAKMLRQRRMIKRDFKKVKHYMVKAAKIGFTKAIEFCQSYSDLLKICDRDFVPLQGIYKDKFRVPISLTADFHYRFENEDSDSIDSYLSGLSEIHRGGIGVRHSYYNINVNSEKELDATDIRMATYYLAPIKRAAEEGLDLAQYQVALLYLAQHQLYLQNQKNNAEFELMDFEKDPEVVQTNPLARYIEALNWFRRAATQGHIKAIRELGQLLQVSSDPQDQREALDWLAKGKAAGDLKAEREYWRLKLKTGDLSGGDLAEFEQRLPEIRAALPEAARDWVGLLGDLRAIQSARTEAENLMAMFSHKFRGSLDSIDYNTRHGGDLKRYRQAIQTMHGMLNVFGLISTDEMRLCDQLASDTSGEGNLTATISHTLDLVLSHLLASTTSSMEKIRHHYRHAAIIDGQVPADISRRDWKNSHYRLESALQMTWEDDYHLTAGEAQNFAGLLTWIASHFFPIRMVGLESSPDYYNVGGIKDSLLMVVLTELLTNLFKYYDGTDPATLTWAADTTGWRLTVTNPTTTYEQQRTDKGSGRGLRFLDTLARKVGGRFTNQTLKVDNGALTHEATFCLPGHLFPSKS